MKLEQNPGKLTSYMNRYNFADKFCLVPMREGMQVHTFSSESNCVDLSIPTKIQFATIGSDFYDIPCILSMSKTVRRNSKWTHLKALPTILISRQKRRSFLLHK